MGVVNVLRRIYLAMYGGGAIECCFRHPFVRIYWDVCEALLWWKQLRRTAQDRKIITLKIFTILCCVTFEFVVGFGASCFRRVGGGCVTTKDASVDGGHS